MLLPADLFDMLCLFFAAADLPVSCCSLHSQFLICLFKHIYIIISRRSKKEHIRLYNCRNRFFVSRRLLLFLFRKHGKLQRQFMGSCDMISMSVFITDSKAYDPDKGILEEVIKENETESSAASDVYSDPRIDSMYSVRHLSRRGGYSSFEGCQYLYGVYRPWLKKKAR